MRKLILTTTAFLCLGGASYFLGTSWGAPKEPAEDVPHRVGLIDINHIFQNYEKLKYLGEEYRAEVQEQEAQLKVMYKKMVDKQAELKELNEGTPEFAAREASLSKLAGDFEARKRLAGIDAKRKEAKMLHLVYLEIQDAVEKMCRLHKFTVVIRFNRVESNSTDPNKINQMLGSTVVYHRKRDDLTNGVLDYLNEKYRSSPEGQARPLANDAEKPPTKPVTSSKKDRNVKPAGGSE